jgi:hypothetical protein
MGSKMRIFGSRPPAAMRRMAADFGFSSWRLSRLVLGRNRASGVSSTESEPDLGYEAAYCGAIWGDSAPGRSHQAEGKNRRVGQS